MAHAEASCFRFLQGESLIRKHLDSNGMGREFCGDCGSPVPGKPDHMQTWSIPSGTLDDDPGVRPVGHVFVSSCAAWWSINDDLPKFEKWPPGMEPALAQRESSKDE